jgi:hypothetical protein
MACHWSCPSSSSSCSLFWTIAGKHRSCEAISNPMLRRMQAQILQACKAPSDPQTNNKLEELRRQSPLHLEKATLNSKNSWETNPRGFWQRNQTLGASSRGTKPTWLLFSEWAAKRAHYQNLWMDRKMGTMACCTWLVTKKFELGSKTCRTVHTWMLPKFVNGPKKWAQWLVFGMLPIFLNRAAKRVWWHDGPYLNVTKIS